jgi:glycerol-3-phosphate acyltransferase PlsY
MSTEVLFIILAVILAYLIGSFPSAFIIARLRKGVDIRQVGSRNMGAMNTFYKVGFWWGMLVLILDIGKGALAVGVAYLLTGNFWVELAAGLVVIIGHGFPVFLKFKGGKGGATAIGVLVYLMPWGTPIYLVVFLAVMGITRFPTLSYSLAFFIFPFVGWLIHHNLALAIYPVAVVLIPLFRYIPRIFEMKAKAGSWKNVAMRRNLKDRL